MLLKLNATNWHTHSHTYKRKFSESVLSLSAAGVLIFRGYLHFITKRVLHREKELSTVAWKSFEFIAIQCSNQWTTCRSIVIDSCTKVISIYCKWKSNWKNHNAENIVVFLKKLNKYLPNIFYKICYLFSAILLHFIRQKIYTNISFDNDESNINN